MINKSIHTNAILRAYEFMRERLLNGVWREGARLPAIGTIAGMARVSRATAWKALSRLKQENLVTTRRGGRTIAGVSDTLQEQHFHQTPALAWQRMRTEIENDITTGLYRAGYRLPTSAELQARYGISTPTLLKALNALVDDGVLARERRRFVVPRPNGASS